MIYAISTEGRPLYAHCQLTYVPQEFSASICHPTPNFWLVPIPARDMGGVLWVRAKFAAQYQYKCHF